MNCRRVCNYLSAYMDGELAGVEQQQIRDHLDRCLACRDEYEQTLAMKRMLTGLRGREPRPELQNLISQGLERERFRAENTFSGLVERAAMIFQREVPVSPVVAFAGGAAVLVMLLASNTSQIGARPDPIQWHTPQESTEAIFASQPPLADPRPVLPEAQTVSARFVPSAYPVRYAAPREVWCGHDPLVHFTRPVLIWNAQTGRAPIIRALYTSH